MMNTKRKHYNIFKMFAYLFPMVFKAVPVYYIVLMVLQLATAFLMVSETFFTQRFFDTAANNNSQRSIILAMVLFATAYIGRQLVDLITTYLRESMINKVDGIMSFRIHEKAGKIDPICYENSNILDGINKAEMGKNHGDWLVFLFVSVVFFNIPYFIMMSWYLFKMKYTLAIALIIAFIPMVISQVMKVRIYSDLEEEIAPKRRAMSYYYSYGVDRAFFKETRLLGAFYFFKSKYEYVLKEVNKLTLKAGFKSNLRELAVSILTLLGYAVVLLLLFFAVMNREISIGAFAAVFAAIASLYSLMDNFVSFKIGFTMRNLGSIQNYIDFLNMEERTGEDLVLPNSYDIKVENVTFKYPESNKNAIENISFSIKAGESIAIVGENGSGKSTLIRLLLGLYLPDSGEVYYNGISTKKLAPKSIFNNKSAVFQNFNKYDLTLKQNILVSNPDLDFSDQYITEICKSAGVEYDGVQYINGLDTMLSRIFDGIELSGGQYQRVAIARGFFRKHSFIVLDEPTSAIDPIEESRIYKKFAEETKYNSCVIVTHRLGSVHLTDRIIVMKDGSIEEMGSHGDLIKANGEYARLYEAQKKWYTRNTNSILSFTD